jgi:hypothetical protein
MKIATLANPSVLKAQDSKVSRNQLQELRHKLVNPRSGQVTSGYLRLSKAGSLNVGSWFTKGSKANAIASIKDLINNAYGHQLDQTGQRQKVETSIDAYLKDSGQALGSKSFVKLIDSLEAGLHPDDASQAAEVPSTARTASARLGLSAGNFSIPPTEIESLASPSPIGSMAIDQFKELSPHLERNTLNHFSGLMFPMRSALNNVSATQSIEINAPRTFAMGDADGSIGRMLLHVIASGVGHLPVDKMPLLAKVLEAEAKFGQLLEFQSNHELSDAHDELAKALVVTPQTANETPACLFMGDILSDRFTNNQQAMSTMIYKLKGYDPLDLLKPPVETGVRFIAGNHDAVVPKSNAGDSPDASWGEGAAVKLTEPQYRELLFKCFDVAIYAGGVFSTHQGIAASHRENYYQVGLNVWLNQSQLNSHPHGARLADNSVVQDSLRIKASSPHELAEMMNNMFREALRSHPSIADVVATNFRPSDVSMKADSMWFSKEEFSDFRQLHGHNGDANEAVAGVTNLNPRANGQRFAPTSTVVEYSSQFNDSMVTARSYA